MSASDDEEKCDSGREGDVADGTESTNGVLGDRHTEGKKGKSRNTTPLLGLKTTQLY